MRINDDHLYHGAALTQVAEYPTFKAINAFEPKKGEKSRSAFTVNHDTGVYLKYATSPNGIGEYVFTFNEANVEELAALEKQYGDRVFIVLVCRTAKEICVNTLAEFEKKRAQRETGEGVSGSNIYLAGESSIREELQDLYELSGDEGNAIEARIGREPEPVSPGDLYRGW